MPETSRGEIGEKVTSPASDYIHERKAEPDKKAHYYTLHIGGGKLLRMMEKKGKSKVQSVLTPKE
jgi:hypothetical protein